ncbi:MAG: iron-containing alcohol dehydrogenase [Pseudomonadota bacterium]
MMNFVYKNPTEILFGKGMIAEIASRVPGDVPVLFLYGGGSIKRNSVYNQVKAALQNHHLIEFAGIEPNPLYETCTKAVEVVKREGVRFILAVGGGSVLDAGKFIAAAALYEGSDPWEILRTHGADITSALPVGTVLTLPATGSESNGNSVISRKATSEKLHFTSQLVFPVFSVLDPEATFSLPRKQVRNGIVDSFVHVMEQYMAGPVVAPLQDRISESVLQTLVEVGPCTLERPDDYDARAAFMWCATIALNTQLGCGVPQDWSTHMIGHEVTAFYGLDHAETLAVVLPGVWRHKLDRKRAKLKQYGHRIWGGATEEESIAKTETFFHSIGMPTHLSDYSISADEAAALIEARFNKRKVAFGEDLDINGAAAAAILRLRK